MKRVTDSRLDKLAVDQVKDAMIVVIRWGDDDTPLESLPCSVYQNGQTTRYHYGINTVPEHLRAGPVKHIHFTWGDDD